MKRSARPGRIARAYLVGGDELRLLGEKGAHVEQEVRDLVAGHELAIVKGAQALIDQREGLGDDFRFVNVVAFGGLRHYVVMVPIFGDHYESLA